MYYGEIKKCDIANGPGVRVSLFVSGCRNHCPGCFNKETWDFCYGKPFTPETKGEAVSLSDKQQKLLAKMFSESARITYEFINGEERSFTIISKDFRFLEENHLNQRTRKNWFYY